MDLHIFYNKRPNYFHCFLLFFHNLEVEKLQFLLFFKATQITGCNFQVLQFFFAVALLRCPCLILAAAQQRSLENRAILDIIKKIASEEQMSNWEVNNNEFFEVLKNRDDIKKDARA